MKLTPDQEEFRLLMERAGWSAAETARRLNLARSSISLILSGQNNPTRSLPLLRFMVREYLERKKITELSEQNEADEAEQGGVPSDPVLGIVSSGRGSSNAPLTASRMYGPTETFGGVELREEKVVQSQLAEIKKSDPEKYQELCAIIGTYHTSTFKKKKGKAEK